MYLKPSPRFPMVSLGHCWSERSNNFIQRTLCIKRTSNHKKLILNHFDKFRINGSLKSGVSTDKSDHIKHITAY